MGCNRLVYVHDFRYGCPTRDLVATLVHVQPARRAQEHAHSSIHHQLQRKPHQKIVTSFGCSLMLYLLYNRTEQQLWYFTIAFFFNCACFAVEIAVNDPIFSHMPSPVAFCM